MLHKKPPFAHSENEKCIFYKLKLKTSLSNIVRHAKTTIFAQYGPIQKNYSMYVAITLVIWLESHETLYVIAPFENTFYKYLQYCKFVIFCRN